MEENTGLRLGANREDVKSNLSSNCNETDIFSQRTKQTKLRRRRRGGSPDSAASEPENLENIFDDDGERNGIAFDQDEMAGFIEDDTQSEASGSEDERRRAAARKKKSKDASRSKGRGGIASSGEGLTAEAWQEVQDLFGNGKDYESAMEEDADDQQEKRLEDVRFQPVIYF